jgi:hypothetical protein
LKRLTAGGIAFGAFLSVIGFIIVFSTVGQENPHETRSLGLLLISFGFLIAAVVLYLDGRRVQSTEQKERLAAARNDPRLRCFVCGDAMATMRCQKHMIRVCADCVSKHDEGAQCFYVPLSRYQKGS